MLPYAGLALGWSGLYYDDSLRFDVPMTGLINEALRSGRLPLWNPYVGMGTPLISDVSALPVYPARILGCLLPAGQALGLLLLIQLGVLAAGATALLRDLGALSVLAAAAGAALALAGPTVLADQPGVPDLAIALPLDAVVCKASWFWPKHDVHRTGREHRSGNTGRRRSRHAFRHGNRAAGVVGGVPCPTASRGFAWRCLAF